MNRTRLFLTQTAILCSILACSIFIGGPEYPENSIPISAEAIESLNAQVEAALLAGAESGTVTLQINEEQLTSYLAFRQSAQDEPAFQKPQVYLRDGQMQIYGVVERGILTANIFIALEVSVDPEGKPQIEISAADFGPFPAPEGLKQSMTAIITEAYTGTLGPVATGFRLDSITIADGLMTLTGSIN